MDDKERKDGLELMETLAKAKLLLSKYDSGVAQDLVAEIVEFQNNLDEYIQPDATLTPLENKIYVQYYWNGDTLKRIAEREDRDYAYVRTVAGKMNKKLPITKECIENAFDDMEE